MKVKDNFGAAVLSELIYPDTNNKLVYSNGIIAARITAAHIV